MVKALRAQADLTRGMLNTMVRDARFINAFPGMQKFIRTVVYTKQGGCGGCGGARRVRSYKKKVVNYNGLKKHILGMLPAKKAEVKRLLGVRALNIAFKQSDNKVVTSTI